MPAFRLESEVHLKIIYGNGNGSFSVGLDGNRGLFISLDAVHPVVRVALLR